MSAAQSNSLLVLPQATEHSHFLTNKIQAILIGPFETGSDFAQPSLRSEHVCPHNLHFTEKRDANVAVLTVSDRTFRGHSEDLSGQYLVQALLEQFNGEVLTKVVPDEFEQIKGALLAWAGSVDLILTTGGTGLAPRDVTPEATRAVLEREADGIRTLMMHESLQHTRLAALSRSVAGTRAGTLIVNMPGSLKAVRECFGAIREVLPHALSLLKT